MSKILGHFINNADVNDDNRPTPVYNPATGELTKHVAMASKATVEEMPRNLPGRFRWPAIHRRLGGGCLTT